MIYTFKCDNGHGTQVESSIKVGPPSDLICGLCGEPMGRDWKADAPMIDTSGCKDHSDVKPEHQTRSAWTKGSSATAEHQFQRGIDARRRQIRDAGGQHGSVKQTHAVPAELFHGKIKETGDKRYWDDPRNLAKHKECKVDD